MRCVGFLVLVLMALVLGAEAARAHDGPCPEHRASAARVVTSAERPAAHGCGTDQIDCHMPDCCQAGPVVDLAVVAGIGHPYPAALDLAPAPSSRWTEPTQRVFRPPAQG